MTLRSRPAFFLVVGGPSGVGKSTAFPLGSFNVDSFNVDEYCARVLNDGSFQNFTPEHRLKGLAACDEFVQKHFDSGRSVAIEASLRRDITFEQVWSAKAAGLQTQLIFLGNDNVEENIRRVRARAARGGHAAPPVRLKDIYRGSMANLARGLREFDTADVYDNTAHVADPELVLQAEDGRVACARPPAPDWLRDALRGTEYEHDLSGR